MRKVLITGGAGFIGSHAVNTFANDKQFKCTAIIDKFTYAAEIERIEDSIKKHKLKLFKQDLATASLGFILEKVKPDIIINFAAESHVDNSIVSDLAGEFINSNYTSVVRQITAIREYYHKTKKKILFVHVSTDEVLGDLPLGSKEELDEQAPLRPNNVYSATKAAAEQMIEAMHHTYQDFRYVIVRATNNYGPGQHFEKFIPTIIRKLTKNEKIPVYGNGQNIREWLWVGDFVRGIRCLLDAHYNQDVPGIPGSIFHFGSGLRVSNLTVVNTILRLMNKPDSFIEFVDDRLGHDRKYALKWRKAKSVLSWLPEKDFEDGIQLTIENVQKRMEHEPE